VIIDRIASEKATIERGKRELAEKIAAAEAEAQRQREEDEKDPVLI